MGPTTEETAFPENEPALLAAGSVVAGRYEIVKSLGSGGMGSVYLCKDRVLNEDQVAIKILHNDLAADEQQTKRFLREVQLIRKINHRNVVRTFDIGVDGSHMYFTMEYIPGKPLEELIEKGKVKMNEVGPLLINIAEGLDAIHQAGVIHRDLKPANVMVMDDGSIKITDFGVARPEDSNLTAHDEIIGSVLFMAPEIWLGKKLTPAIDLYALGILGYVLTTGEYPFDAEKPAALMRLHLDSAPVPPKDKNADVPVWLNKLILRLIEKNPAKRPESAVDVVEYIKTYTNQRAAAAGGKNQPAAGSENPADFLNKLEELSQSSVQKAVEDSASGKRKRTESYVLDVPVRSALFRKMKKDSSAGAKARAKTNPESFVRRASFIGSIVSPLIGAAGAGALAWSAARYSDAAVSAVAGAFQTVVLHPAAASLIAPSVMRACGLAMLPLIAAMVLAASIGGRPLRLPVAALASVPAVAIIFAGAVWYCLSGIGDADTGFYMQSGVLVEYLGALVLLSPWAPSRSGSEMITLSQDPLAAAVACAFVFSLIFTLKRACVAGPRRFSGQAAGLCAAMAAAFFVEGALFLVGAPEVQIPAAGAVVRLPEGGIWICLTNWTIVVLSGLWFRRSAN